MNRRDLLKRALAIPIVAALAPLLPKSVAPTSWVSPNIDLTPAPVVPRYLRYKITWPGTAVFNERAVARLTGWNESRYSDPLELAGAGDPWLHEDDHVTVYPMCDMRNVGDQYDVVVEQSDDARTWTKADPDRVHVKAVLPL